MRNYLLLLAFAVSTLLYACTSADDDALLVAELTDGEQVALCEAVLDDCVDAICADPCVANGCAAAVADGDIDTECAGVFEDEAAVDACILDALDLNCP